MYAAKLCLKLFLLCAIVIGLWPFVYMNLKKKPETETSTTLHLISAWIWLKLCVLNVADGWILKEDLDIETSNNKPSIYALFHFFPQRLNSFFFDSSFFQDFQRARIFIFISKPLHFRQCIFLPYLSSVNFFYLFFKIFLFFAKILWNQICHKIINTICSIHCSGGFVLGGS